MKKDKLWVILIDTSGSMGDAFAGGNEYEGRVKRGNYEIKLDAAKAAVIEEVGGIRGGSISLIKFNHQAEEIYRGKPSNKDELQKKIHSLRPNGGTDIGEALNFGIDLNKGNDSFQSIDFILISDGLSGREAADRAALRCSQLEITVFPTVIDPTDEGLEVAESISEITGGKVFVYKSEGEKETPLNISVRNSINLGQNNHELKEYHKEQELHKNAYATKLGGITALFGLIVIITGVINGILENPPVALPVSVAALVFSVGALMVVQGFSKKTAKHAIWISDTENYHPKEPKYSSSLRFMFGIGGVTCILFSIGLGFFAYAQSNKLKQGHVVNSIEIEELFNQDRFDRINSQGESSWDNINKRDSLRRARIRELIDLQYAQTAEDYYRAAAIYQRGSDTSRYRAAYIWLRRAIELDSTHSEAKKLVAELLLKDSFLNVDSYQQK